MPRAPFPSGRKFLLLIAVAAGIIGGAWWRYRPPPDPVYKGERLSQAFFEPHDFGSRRALREYFHGFGPAGVRWLGDKFEYGRRELPRNEPLPFDGVPDWLRRWLPEKWRGLDLIRKSMNG
jgi:hypothetical protein